MPSSFSDVIPIALIIRYPSTGVGFKYSPPANAGPEKRRPSPGGASRSLPAAGTAVTTEFSLSSPAPVQGPDPESERWHRRSGLGTRPGEPGLCRFLLPAGAAGGRGCLSSRRHPRRSCCPVFAQGHCFFTPRWSSLAWLSHPPGVGSPGGASDAGSQSFPDQRESGKTGSGRLASLAGRLFLQRRVKKLGA